MEQVTENLVRQNGNQAAAVMADYAGQGGAIDYAALGFPVYDESLADSYPWDDVHVKNGQLFATNPEALPEPGEVISLQDYINVTAKKPKLTVLAANSLSEEMPVVFISNRSAIVEKRCNILVEDFGFFVGKGSGLINSEILRSWLNTVSGSWLRSETEVRFETTDARLLIPQEIQLSSNGLSASFFVQNGTVPDDGLEALVISTDFNDVDFYRYENV